MLLGNLWRIALAVVCALGALTLMVTALKSRRRRPRARTVLSAVLAGALLLIGATPLLISAQTFAPTASTPASVANHDAPVADGVTVYAVTDTKATSDTVVALAARTGAIRWSKVFTGGVVYIRARGPMDVIVEANKIGSGGSEVLALRASDGATLWVRALEGFDDASGSLKLLQTVLPLDATGAATSPLFVLTRQPSPLTVQSITRFAALRASDGTVLWQDTAPASMPLKYSNPVATPGVILFESSLYQQDGVTGDMELLTVNAATGQAMWATKIHQGPNATLRDFVADERVAYVATYDDAKQTQEIEALRLTDGKVVWRVNVDPTSGMLGLTGSGGVMAATQTKVIALDVASGKTLWTVGKTSSVSPDVAVRASGDEPIVHANTVYFMAWAGNTYPQQPTAYAVDAATGATRWTYHTPDGDATMQWKNAEVYILAGSYGVIALDGATGALRWRLSESGGLGNPDWTAAPDTIFLKLSVNAPPRPWHICEGGVLYPFVWALSSDDGSVYWRTLIADGHAYGSTGCA